MAGNIKKIIEVQTKGARKSEKQIKGVSGALGGLAKKAGAAAAAYFGTRALIGGIASSIDAFKKQELAEKKLEAALGKTSQALLNHASALQKVTMFGDETIIEAQAMIASFVKDEEAVRLATEATLDLAAAKGFDLVAAADLVSKTLGSSTNALTRYGIEVTGAVGSTERLTSLTENIASVFGGQATAQAQTLTGSMEQLKNSFGDLQETITTEFAGELTTASQSVKGWIDSITTSLKLNQLDAFLASEAYKKLGEQAQLSNQIQKQGLLETAILLEENPTLVSQIGSTWSLFNSTINQSITGIIKLLSDATGVTELWQLGAGDLSEEWSEFQSTLTSPEIERLKAQLAETNAEIERLTGNIGTNNEQQNDSLSTQEVFNEAKQKEYDLLVATNKESEQENALLQTWIKGNKDKAKELGIVSDKEKKRIAIMGDISKAIKGSGELEQRVSQINAIINTAEAITEFISKGQWGRAALAGALGYKQVSTIESQKFALGANYVTSGPEMIMVGDNPSGQERVQVTPLGGDPNINGPQGSNIVLNISGNVMSEQYTEDVIIPQIKEGLRLGGNLGIN